MYTGKVNVYTSRNGYLIFSAHVLAGGNIDCICANKCACVPVVMVQIYLTCHLLSYVTCSSMWTHFVKMKLVRSTR